MLHDLFNSSISYSVVRIKQTVLISQVESLSFSQWNEWKAWIFVLELLTKMAFKVTEDPIHVNQNPQRPTSPASSSEMSFSS